MEVQTIYQVHIKAAGKEHTKHAVLKDKNINELVTAIEQTIGKLSKPSELRITAITVSTIQQGQELPVSTALPLFNWVQEDEVTLEEALAHAFKNHP